MNGKWWSVKRHFISNIRAAASFVFGGTVVWCDEWNFHFVLAHATSLHKQRAVLSYYSMMTNTSLGWG